MGTNVSWGMPTAWKVPGVGHRMGVGRRGQACMHPKKWGSETPLEGSVHTDPWRSTAMCYPTKRYPRLK